MSIPERTYLITYGNIVCVKADEHVEFDHIRKANGWACTAYVPESELAELQAALENDRDWLHQAQAENAELRAEIADRADILEKLMARATIEDGKTIDRLREAIHRERDLYHDVIRRAIILCKQQGAHTGFSFRQIIDHLETALGACYREGGVMVEWTRESGVECVVAPCCGFTFDAGHEDVDGGGYSCPACSEIKLRAAIDETVTAYKEKFGDELWDEPPDRFDAAILALVKFRRASTGKGENVSESRPMDGSMMRDSGLTFTHPRAATGKVDETQASEPFTGDCGRFTSPDSDATGGAPFRAATEKGE